MKDQQFSLKSLLVVVTMVALLVGVLWTSYQSSRVQVRLEREVATLQLELANRDVELRNAIGDGLRTVYAEKLLLEVLARSEEYPEMVSALKNGLKQKVGVSLHPLDEDDGRTYVNVYSMNVADDAAPFCFSFLVKEEPFEVLDHISGERSRMARRREGHWYCGAGQDGQDVWYRITEDGFQRIDP